MIELYIRDKSVQFNSLYGGNTGAYVGNLWMEIRGPINLHIDGYVGYSW